MGRCAIASSDAIRLPLSDGDFITVKKELNAGESLDLAEVPGNRTLAALLAYLVGWSLVGIGDAPIPYSPAQPLDERRDILRSLTESKLEEILAVLGPHIRAVRLAVDEKKTTPLVEVGS
jgi:hypothetical protein